MNTVAPFRERLVFDDESGALMDQTRRYMLIRPEALMGIFRRLPAPARRQALEAFAESIVEQGSDSARAYAAMEGGGPALARMVAATAPQLGWGTWTIDIGPHSIRVEVRNSPFSAGFGPSDTPVCYPILGMVKAVSTMILGRAPEVHETECAACGSDVCRFEARLPEATCVSAVVDHLIESLGPDRVVVGPDIPPRNHADASGLEPTPPAALILPRSTEDVAAALKICHAYRQPVVTQGGLTGLAGGAHPKAGEIALSLERMSGIEEIDPASATLTALAGTPLALVQQAAEDAGFLCGIDLGARGSCTIGGNIATNAGGNQVLRYGMARRNTLGLEVVLADGTVVRSLNKMLKNNAGYDWSQMFIGSEGTLGVVTRAVLALQPKPQELQTALCAVNGFDDALATLRSLEQRFPGSLLVFEAMWRDFLEVATGRIGLPAPFETEHNILLLVEASAEGAAGAERFETALAELHECGLLRDAIVAKSSQDRARLWAYRESPSEYGRIFPKLVGFDVSIPRVRMGEAVAALRQDIAAGWPQAIQVYFGHIADSNLHVIAAMPNLDDRMKHEVEAAVYERVASFAGSVSAEHGIGRNKRPYLRLSRTDPELALMSTIKRALDPAGILNPSRVL
jgi:FAD/FMN-containing dehydrogenase